MTLAEALKPVSYTATLVLMETERDFKRYSYIFPIDEWITREVLEKHYPDLLTRELSDGIHGEGMRDGLYIHLYKEGR